MKLSEAQIQDRLKDFPNWDFEDNAIHTVIEFENFKEVFATMTRIAFEAEEQNHHPDWSNKLLIKERDFSILAFAKAREL